MPTAWQTDLFIRIT